MTDAERIAEILARLAAGPSPTGGWDWHIHYGSDVTWLLGKIDAIEPPCQHVHWLRDAAGRWCSDCGARVGEGL